MDSEALSSAVLNDRKHVSLVAGTAEATARFSEIILPPKFRPFRSPNDHLIDEDA
jgi:hypothetical protein